MLRNTEHLGKVFIDLLCLVHYLLTLEGKHKKETRQTPVKIQFPASTQRCFNVHLTFTTSKKRCMNVETCWVLRWFIIPSPLCFLLHRHHFVNQYLLEWSIHSNCYACFFFSIQQTFVILSWRQSMFHKGKSSWLQHWWWHQVLQRRMLFERNSKFEDRAWYLREKKIETFF